MGLINWLKQKIFHKKDEAKKEEKPVEPVVEENLKSEEAKDKTRQTSSWAQSGILCRNSPLR